MVIVGLRSLARPLTMQLLCVKFQEQNKDDTNLSKELRRNTRSDCLLLLLPFGQPVKLDASQPVGRSIGRWVGVAVERLKWPAELRNSLLFWKASNELLAGDPSGNRWCDLTWRRANLG